MSNHIWGDQETSFFHSLTPDIILNAVESLGIKVTGRCLTLNSMENRVYEVEIENDEAKTPSERFVIAKFYRPGRWNREQILDEHQFLFDLKGSDIPAIAPIQFNNESLFLDKETKLLYCLFPKKGGRMPQEMTDEQLEITGRLLARIHLVGASKVSDYRLKIHPDVFARANLNYLLKKKIIPGHLEKSYEKNVLEICDLSVDLFKNIETHRIHGDCHWGNIILRDEEISFIDFDDMLTGPAVQDIWLVVPGEDQESIIRRNLLLDAYETMKNFDRRTLKLIEPLRALRYIHFSSWIAKRWEDQAFKNAFPHFQDLNYWDIQIRDLEVQIQKIKNQTSSPHW